MPEITREEAKTWLQREMEKYERGRDSAREIGWNPAPYVVGAAALRLSLAALEDAERVDALERDLLECNAVLSEEDGEYEIDRGAGAPLSKGESLRAAIDRARGVNNQEET